jgi:hypothetical protein
VDRRAFLGTLATGAITAPLAAEAQRAAKVPRIGYLSLFEEPSVKECVTSGTSKVTTS